MSTKLPTECVDCEGRLTRRNRASVTEGALGYDDMCQDCYIKSGLVNSHQDGHHKPGEESECPLCVKHNEKQASSKAPAKKPTAGKTTATKPVKKSPPKQEGKESITRGISKTTPKTEISKAKARKLLAVAEEHGWTLKDFAETEPGVFWIKVEREGEVLVAGWDTGVWIYPARYEYGERTLNIINASAAKRRLSSPPDVVMPRKRSNGERKSAAGRVIARRIPFVIGETKPDEILSIVEGKRIIWVNSISGQPEEATVKIFQQREKETAEQFTARKARGLHLTSGQAGRPILTFVSGGKEGAFRSVALSSILQVG